MPYTDHVLDLPFFTPEECNDIKSYCYEVEKELIDNGFDKHRENHALGDVVTTNNYFRYNFFAAHPHFADRFADFMWQTNKDVEWPIAVQSWVNIYRKGQGIKWHNHQGSMGKSFSANIFIDGPTKPGITYKPFNEKAIVKENIKGHIHVFPCELFHMVPPIETDEDRITVGITVHSFKDINHTMIDQLAFNSRTYQDTIILSKEHHQYGIGKDIQSQPHEEGEMQSHTA
tara:strand:- start:1981 stop:2670 length:690 start_codon:yes stop_codon:yes gene_type:complete